jgi:DNA repair exonuclease SbcCD nuclease subunit
MNLIWISDIHLGLVTDGISRNEEIFEVMDRAINKAIELDAYFILGGDIFNKNNPSEELIAKFIKRVLNPLNKGKVKTYIMVGNHDSIHEQDHLSCLSFIRELDEYPYIKLVDDIITMKPKTDSDIGPIYFTFLPHITRSHLKGEKTPQEYIDNKCEKITDKYGNDNHYVFSHLNVIGAAHGSEEKLHRSSTVFLPKSFVADNMSGKGYPTIIQGHIHSPSIINNINIIGSPIFCSYGENDNDKNYLHLEIPTRFGEQLKFNYINTLCRKFKQIELDLVDSDIVTLESNEDFLKFREELDNTCYAKVSVMVSGNSQINFEAERELLIKQTGAIVKPIVPKIVRKRVKRNSNQVKELNIEEAIKLFLKDNKPKRIKDKWDLAKKYIGG